MGFFANARLKAGATRSVSEMNSGRKANWYMLREKISEKFQLSHC
jgi:hypothetical protein